MNPITSPAATPIDYALWQRAGALYLPLITALLLALTQQKRPRRFAACLLSFLWTIPTLLILQRLNQLAGWWTFPTLHTGDDVLFRAMPLELYFGWIILWGILPQLALLRLPLFLTIAIMAAFDVVAMPLCNAAIHLSPTWLIGEAVAILLVLAPALSLARATLQDTHLPLRAALQVATSGLLFLYFIPEAVFALRPGSNWSPLLDMPAVPRQLALLLLVLLALPGVGAVMEFAQRGHGTPIPYDPPKRLVTSCIYRYVANPMQLSCTLVMLLWSAILRNPWLLIGAGITVLYSVGIARWDERQDLALRFGTDWHTYRQHVHDWLPRLHPYQSSPAATLYLATTCAPCTQLQRWIQHRSPRGLEILPAESLPQNSIQRMTYNPNDGTPAISGVRALARVIEHLHIGWAIAGTALRLPILWQLVQLLMDASGLGPRTICAAPTALPASVDRA